MQPSAYIRHRGGAIGERSGKVKVADECDCVNACALHFLFICHPFSFFFVPQAAQIQLVPLRACLFFSAAPCSFVLHLKSHFPAAHATQARKPSKISKTNCSDRCKVTGGKMWLEILVLLFSLVSFFIVFLSGFAVKMRNVKILNVTCNDFSLHPFESAWFSWLFKGCLQNKQLHF